MGWAIGFYWAEWVYVWYLRLMGISWVMGSQ